MKHFLNTCQQILEEDQESQDLLKTLLVEQEDDFNLDDELDSEIEETVEGPNEEIEELVEDDINPDNDFENPAKRQQKYVDVAKQWIKKLDEFAEHLNGVDLENGLSLNGFFNEIDRQGSIFNGISKQSNQVVKIAEAIKTLSETLKGYIINSKTKARQLEL